MKRLIHIFSAFVLLVGCAIDSPVIYDPELRMLFQPEIYMHISQEDVDRYPTDQDFAVCAWASGKKWFNTSKAASQEIVLTDTLRKVQVMDTLWALDQEVLWPRKGEVVTFTAYSPYEADCNITKDKGVEWSTDDILDSQTDILYSHCEMDRSQNVDGNVVNLCFSHALCKINFRVKNRVDNEGALDALNRPDKITVLSIKVNGVKIKGSFCSLPSAEWTLDGDKVELPIYEGTFVTGGIPEPIGNNYLMIPQKLDTEVTVKFQYTTFANTTITQVIKTVPMKTDLQPGRNYTYTLSVGIDDVKFLHELIEEELR